MFKRIAVCLVVTVAVSAALFFAAIAWIEHGEGPPAAGHMTDGKEDQSVAAAYHIDREGRALATSGRPPEDQQKAEAKYLESLAMFKKLGHERGEAEVLNDLGILYSAQRKDVKAAEYYEKSLEIKRRIGWSWGEGNSLSGLAHLYWQRKQYNKVAEYYEQAVKAYEKAGDLNSANEIVNYLPNAYVILGQYSKAIEAYERALEIAGKRKDAKAQAKLSSQVAPLYYVERNYAKAAEHCLNALESQEKLDDTNRTKILRELLGDTYRAWVKIDPGNEQLKRVKLVLDKGTEKDALAEEMSRVTEAIRVGEVKALPAKGANVNVCDKYGRLPLETAAEKGDIELVRQLIDSGADLKIKDRSGAPAMEAALTAAMRSCREEVARYFLDMGANINAVGPKEITPLQFAVNCSPDFVKTLLEKGVDVNTRGKDGMTVLMHAAKAGNLEVVKLLVDQGADLNAKDNYNRTPLMAAAWPMHVKGANHSIHESHAGNERGNREVIKFLIDKRADINAKDAHGTTALMESIRGRYLDTARLLLENGADVNAKDALSMVVASLEYPSNRAVPSDRLRSCLEVVKLLLDRGADVNSKDLDKRMGQMGLRTALLRFSAEGFPEVVKLLLEHGAEVNATLNDGSNALFCALWGRDYSFSYPLSGVQGLERQKKHDWSRYSQAVPSDRRSETAKLLVTHGIDVNAKLKTDGSTALSWAAFIGDAELVKLLLDKGAEVDSRLADGRTPLICSVTSDLGFETLKELGALPEEGNGDAKKGKASKIEILKKLGSLSEANSRKQNRPALKQSFDARQIDVVKLLLDRKADVNARLPDGTTSLFWASILGHTETVKLLLERGADANATLTDGSTILQWATLYDRAEVVNLLTEFGGRRTLAAAAMSGLSNEVQRLLDKGADVNAKDAHGATALMESVRGGYLETTRLLLEKGADVQVKDERGSTALNEALWKGDLDVAALLLEKEADPNAVDAYGWTPLIQAAWKGQRNAVNLLVAKGADIRAKDAFGKTAFMRAVEMGHGDVAALLLDKGADVNDAEADGWTPVMAAAMLQDWDTLRLLRKRGAGMTVAAAVLLDDEKEMQRLVGERAKNGTQIADAPLALLIAARNGREDMVKLLLDRRSDIDIKDSCCDTALLLAIEKRHAGIAKALLENGANVNAADDWGETTLHYAARSGDLKLVRMLLEKGADVNARTIMGDTPLVRALENAPNVEIVKVLLEKGANLNASPNSDFMSRAVKRANKEILELLKAHGLNQTD